MYSASDSHILDFDTVSFSYDQEKSFLQDMSAAIKNGEFIGLLGANGSGKSTILKLASGILRPLRGRIHLWGKALDTYKNRDRAKLVSYLPQFLDLNIPFTVREFVSMGRYPYDTLPELSVEEAIGMVGLSEYEDTLISNLSGGERRRVYIAMTLLQGAGLVLLDEPLANLDIKYQIELLKLLQDLRERRNITAIMALHDINIAFQFDRLILVKEGRILGSGTPQEVLTQELLKEAFDVTIEMKREERGGVFIRY
ncbi:MAG: ABC transporter ATP-binding protein [Nitrospiraceae bacterium]|nr:MAG: ABC transporter ATP-binding protein [Nitrospiraceae bacterium]UCH45043.1 MAG: ABC transporter ATP-binding protein [Nitrospiraceae bacterium]